MSNWLFFLQHLLWMLLYPKPKFTINWENTIMPLVINTTSPQNPIVRSSTINTSTLGGCNTQITVLEKTPIYLPCVPWVKEKSHFLFSLNAAQSTIIFPSVSFKTVFHYLVSLNLSLCLRETTCINALY